MSTTVKITIAIIAVVLIAGGGWFYSRSSVSKISPQGVVMTKTISYTGSAFTPATVEVRVGDAVTFVNNGTGGMWVASAPHPTHTDYPEFDAKKEYNPGESYIFTFTKAGTWKYHNHKNPSAFGTIVVK